MKVNCTLCDREIEYNSCKPPKYCKKCAISVRREYHKRWWQLNKDRYKRDNRVGNPDQDDEILAIIRKKRKMTERFK